MPRNATWSNKDSLVIGYGKHTSDDSVPAVTTASGGVKTMQVVIDSAVAPLTAAATAFADTHRAPQAAVIKRGSKILSATFTVLTAFTGGGTNTTLSIGTWGIPTREYPITAASDTTGGIDTTIALSAIDAVGATVQCDGTLVGATYAGGLTTVGAASASDCVISYTEPGSSAFTAGKGLLTIQYVEPTGWGGATAPLFVE